MNQREYEALEDEYLTHEARTLYVLCLRRYMDFSTGFVGTAKRRISYQQFKEYLSVSRPRRSTVPAFVPSRQQLRGYIDELVRVGLVVRMAKVSKTDPMVFRLPLATTDINQPDFFQSNEEQHLSNQRQEPLQQHEEEPKQAQKKQGFNRQEQQEEQPEEQHKSNQEEQHTSVTSVNNTSHTHNAREAEALESFDQRFGGAVDAHPKYLPEFNQPVSRKFAMYSNWQPDHTFTDQAKTLGLDLTTLTSEQGESVQIALEEFRTWWMESRRGVQETQRLWQQKFIQTSLKRELEKQRGNTHGDSNQQGKRRHSGSAMSRPYTADDFDLDATW